MFWTSPEVKIFCLFLIRLSHFVLWQVTSKLDLMFVGLRKCFANRYGLQQSHTSSAGDSSFCTDTSKFFKMVFTFSEFTFPSIVKKSLKGITSPAASCRKLRSKP